MQLALESARTIVKADGIAGLSARKVTHRMGYTIGTLYQHFDGMDGLVERMNADTLAALYDHCSTGAVPQDVALRLRAFGLRITEFVQTHPREWDAVMSYRYKKGHTGAEFYYHETSRLFGLLQAATGQFYSDDEREDQAADLAMLWASLTGIWGVASSERELGGTLEQMIDRLIAMYLKARS